MGGRLNVTRAIHSQSVDNTSAVIGRAYVTKGPLFGVSRFHIGLSGIYLTALHYLFLLAVSYFLNKSCPSSQHNWVNSYWLIYLPLVYHPYGIIGAANPSPGLPSSHA